MKFKVISLIVILLSAMLDGCVSQKPNSEVSSEMEAKSLAVLKDVLKTQSEWVKVHAAEYLIWSGHSEGVKEVYLEEEKLYREKRQYRIGIWRVLAQATDSEIGKKIWTEKIMAVFLDSSATDRTHAAETLAKLKISPLSADKNLTEETLKSPVKPLALYTLWSIAFSSVDSLKAAPAKFLEQIRQAGDDASGKIIPAYALRQLKGLSDTEWEQLATIALAEPHSSPARIYLLSAAFTTAVAGKKPQMLKQIHTELLKYKTAPSKGEISEMAAALADRATMEDLPFLVSLTDLTQLNSEADKADVNAATAYAILKIVGRRK